MKFIEILNLPPPNAELQKLSIDLVDNWEYNRSISNNIQTLVFGEVDINVSLGGQVSTAEITRMVKEQYQQYFDVDIGASLSFFKNEKTQPSCLPPHIHPIRTLALNFYIVTGGNNVETTLFRFKYENPISKFLNYYRYDEVDLLGHVICNNPSWYAFDSSQPHSVENIETTRVLLAITFDPDCKLETITRQKDINYNIML